MTGSKIAFVAAEDAIATGRAQPRLLKPTVRLSRTPVRRTGGG
jgi:hypothetical protein|nr:hypothetical protein [uncultured Rhodopila sp.]